MKLSLSMIVQGGGDPDSLLKSLRSIVPFVDEVCILETHTSEKTQSNRALYNAANDVCERLGVPLIFDKWVDPNGNAEENWISDFSVARNKALDLTSGDLWCWIDSDTVLADGAGWREAVDKGFEDPEVGAMQIRYLYSFADEARTIPTRTVDTRMTFRKSAGRWVNPLHEVIEYRPGIKLLDGTALESHFVHLKREDGQGASSKRNAWVMRKYIERGNTMTARDYVTFATCLMRVEAPSDEVLDALGRCLNSNPSEPDRWKALGLLGGMYDQSENYTEGLSVYSEMAAMRPGAKEPWVYMAYLYSKLERWEDVEAAVQRSMDTNERVQGTVNPLFMRYSPLYSMALACSATGRDEEAVAYFDAALEVTPDLPVAVEHREHLLSRIETRRAAEAFSIAAQYDPGVWKSAPDALYRHPDAARARLPKRERGKDYISIFCGETLTQWGPESVKDGVGGSEEAVIYLSAELRKQGFGVEVYGNPPLKECGADKHGTVWAPASAYRDGPGIFIAWRCPRACLQVPEATARFVWLHDVIRDLTPYTDELKAAVDGVFCLTRFHAKPLIDHGWGDKVIYTTNGLAADLLAMNPGLEPDPNRLAFYSSPDRGLDTLLEAWPLIREELPEAKLDVYYGFNKHWMESESRVGGRREQRLAIEQMLLQDGVSFKGMVPHAQFNADMVEHSIWLYPTEWPETSCITAMKALALGVVPVTSGYADSGVPETLGGYDKAPSTPCNNIYTDKAETRRWVEAVVSAAKEDLQSFRKEASQWAKSKYRWSEVARQWAKVFSSKSQGSAKLEPMVSKAR